MTLQSTYQKKKIYYQVHLEYLKTDFQLITGELDEKYYFAKFMFYKWKNTPEKKQIKY